MATTIRAAFQGELGAFSHAALRRFLGEKARPLPCSSFTEVFTSLSNGQAKFAIVPIENTLHGSVHENYDHLVDSDFRITSEVNIRISHHLITMPEVALKHVKRVFSHPVALNQCRKFFIAHPGIEAVPYYDTAGSAKMLQEQRPEAAAAIASETAAQIYGGVIRRRNLEDDRQNFTRFFLLSKQQGKSEPNRPWKTSLAFSLPNRPGALFKALACFALRDISLTKIESRPRRGKPWEYLFYLDLAGSEDDPAVAKAIANLAELSEFLKVLGSYQSAP